MSIMATFSTHTHGMHGGAGGDGIVGRGGGGSQESAERQSKPQWQRKSSMAVAALLHRAATVDFRQARPL